MEHALAPTEGAMIPDYPAPALRQPKDIINEARIRANALIDIVKEQRLSTRIGQKEHIHIEAWQTVATFYNCTAGADEAEPVEIHGIRGAKAHAKVTDNRTGLVVSEAISFCMQDEPRWSKAAWFQMSSMAQTRAMSKALANKFRWVAVLAGYSGTPAEEMIEEKHSVEQTKQTARTKIAELVHEGATNLPTPQLGNVTRQEDGLVGAGRPPVQAEQALQVQDAPASTILTYADALDRLTLAQNAKEVAEAADRAMTLARTPAERKKAMDYQKQAIGRIGQK